MFHIRMSTDVERWSQSAKYGELREQVHSRSTDAFVFKIEGDWLYIWIFEWGRTVRLDLEISQKKHGGRRGYWGQPMVLGDLDGLY